MEANQGVVREVSGPLEKKSLRNEVFEWLYRRIVSGKYSPGEWLRQEEIANELDVSPTPVREALDKLAAAGLAERIPYRGVRVAQPTTREIADAYVLRLLLEVTAARLAAFNVSQEQAASLSSVLRRTAQVLASDDVSAYQHLNTQLHREIAAATGNRLLGRLCEFAINGFPGWMVYGDLLEQPDLHRSALEQDFREHRVLVESIVGRKPDEASRRALEHIQSVGEELVVWAGVPRDLLEEKVGEIQALLPLRSRGRRGAECLFDITLEEASDST